VLAFAMWRSQLQQAKKRLKTGGETGISIRFDKSDMGVSGGEGAQQLHTQRADGRHQFDSWHHDVLLSGCSQPVSRCSHIQQLEPACSIRCGTASSLLCRLMTSGSLASCSCTAHLHTCPPHTAQELRVEGFADAQKLTLAANNDVVKALEGRSEYFECVEEQARQSEVTSRGGCF
jgi:hypothetical protein